MEFDQLSRAGDDDELRRILPAERILVQESVNPPWPVQQSVSLCQFSR
jgi:hypothetical protein